MDLQPYWVSHSECLIGDTIKMCTKVYYLRHNLSYGSLLFHGPSSHKGTVQTISRLHQDKVLICYFPLGSHDKKKAFILEMLCSSVSWSLRLCHPPFHVIICLTHVCACSQGTTFKGFWLGGREKRQANHSMLGLSMPCSNCHSDLISSCYVPHFLGHSLQSTWSWPLPFLEK